MTQQNFQEYWEIVYAFQVGRVKNKQNVTKWRFSSNRGEFETESVKTTKKSTREKLLSFGESEFYILKDMQVNLELLGFIFDHHSEVKE